MVINQVLNLAAALAVGFIGLGAISVDSIFGIALPEPVTSIIGLVVVVVGVVAAISSKAEKNPPAASATW